MTIDIRCPSCAAGFQVPDRLAGKLIRCKSCRREFRVGGEAPADDYMDEPRPRRRPINSSSSSILVPMLIVGGMLAFCGVVAVGFIVYMAREQAAPPQPFAVPQPQRQFPQPVRVRQIAPNGIVPEHTFLPPRPRAGQPAEPIEGPIVVTLSNLRRAESVFQDRPAYQVDYQTEDFAAGANDRYYLVVKVPAGVSETLVSSFARSPTGVISFAFFPGNDPGQGFDIWVERRPIGKPAERTRVSKVVTLN